MTTAPTFAPALAPPPERLYPSLPADQTWPAQGEWTYDDYLRLPDDGIRYEIIEGVLYMANAPGTRHQYAVHQISVELELAVRKDRSGVVYTSPIEVRLPGIADPVQPDVLFVAEARRKIVKSGFIEGAPDLVVEVLSPSTARRDYSVKMNAYERAGVSEYWIVNLTTHSIQVYELSRQEYALRGEYGPGEYVDSKVLPDLELLTDTVFEA